MVFEDRAQRAVGDAALGVLGDHTQVIVLDRIAVGVELEAAAHRVKLGRRDGLAQGRLVAQVALDVAHGGVHQARRVVTLCRVQRGQAAVVFLEVGHKALVGRVLHVMRPLGGVEHAQHGLAHGADHVLITRKTRSEQRHVFGQTGADKLLDEVDAQATRQKDINRIRPRRAHFGQLGAVVELA